MIKGFKKCDVPCGTSGDWTISRFTLEHMHVPSEGSPYNMILNAISGNPVREIPPGTYTRLTRKERATNNEAVVMSDTNAEMREHAAFVKRACRRPGSRVLVFGLGLGVCVEALLANKNIAHVDVVELSEDVRALTGPHMLARYGADRLTIHSGDANTWVPTDPDAKWTEVWIDIWDTISDTREQMEELRLRYADRTSGQVGCWAEDQVERMNVTYLALDQIKAEFGAALYVMPIPDRIELARVRVKALLSGAVARK